MISAQAPSPSKLGPGRSSQWLLMDSADKDDEGCTDQKELTSLSGIRTRLAFTSQGRYHIGHQRNTVRERECILTICMSEPVQKFTVSPESVEVNEGDDVFLSCVVQNQQGNVQWTKDGFALGFERDVQGYPRYLYSGDSSKGEHHLVIHGITLEDDGEYQCQVGPTAKTSALWASANVTVLVSPSSISILGGIVGELVVAVAGKQLRLQCLVKEARPAPSVAWYRNGIMLDQNMHTERAEPSTQFKRWNVRSRVTLTPKPDDDGQQFSCRALHPSLMNSPTSLVASVVLSVLHPPEAPIISGYSTGDILKEGQEVTLTCRCQGGNPRPRMAWYKNGKLLNHQGDQGGRFREAECDPEGGS
ncbi:kin of IRRE-like protein 2 [Palaemon carinicauda]|uniref:kin of IRRE-like protein 2 n=1 Tax=Palaemon carinicauda TaxID=392227 RepID=UPI0035B682EC